MRDLSKNDNEMKNKRKEKETSSDEEEQISDGMNPDATEIETSGDKTNQLSSSTSNKAIPLALLLLLLRYNRNRQKKLTAPPLVFRQSTPQNDDIVARMGWILQRAIKPSMIATSGIVNSVAAYARIGPAPKRRSIQGNYTKSQQEEQLKLLHEQQSMEYKHIRHNEHLHFREIMKMGSDGAKVAIDWELPESLYSPKHNHPISSHQNAKKYNSDIIDPIKHSILHGPITTPVILILHGINNDASFGYIRALMRTCTDRGWIAAGMNFRGCGGVPLETPRGYTGAYTGDIRSVVHKIAARLEMAVDMGLMKSSQNAPAPLFLVGNSLGANLVVKYLGEEGLAAQEYITQKDEHGNEKQVRAYPTAMPRCIAGGISLGNPLVINSGGISFPWNHLLGWGLKKTLLKNHSRLRKFHDFHFQKAFSNAFWRTSTVGNLDREVAPFLIRNESIPPYSTRIGYPNPGGGPAYWKDASSYLWVDNISVPLLKITAQDDFLVAKHAIAKINHCLMNPNLIVVKTKSGGHLGWFHVGEDDGGGILGHSWADRATADFIAAVIAKRAEESLWSGDGDLDSSPELNAERRKMANEIRQKSIHEPISSKL